MIDEALVVAAVIGRNTVSTRTRQQRKDKPTLARKSVVRFEFPARVKREDRPEQ